MLLAAFYASLSRERYVAGQEQASEAAWTTCMHGGPGGSPMKVLFLVFFSLVGRKFVPAHPVFFGIFISLVATGSIMPTLIRCRHVSH